MDTKDIHDLVFGTSSRKIKMSVLEMIAQSKSASKHSIEMVLREYECVDPEFVSVSIGNIRKVSGYEDICGAVGMKGMCVGAECKSVGELDSVVHGMDDLDSGMGRKIYKNEMGDGINDLISGVGRGGSHSHGRKDREMGDGENDMVSGVGRKIYKNEMGDDRDDLVGGMGRESHSHGRKDREMGDGENDMVSGEGRKIYKNEMGDDLVGGAIRNFSACGDNNKSINYVFNKNILDNKKDYNDTLPGLNKNINKYNKKEYEDKFNSSHKSNNYKNYSPLNKRDENFNKESSSEINNNNYTSSSKNLKKGSYYSSSQYKNYSPNQDKETRINNDKNSYTGNNKESFSNNKESYHKESYLSNKTCASNNKNIYGSNNQESRINNKESCINNKYLNLSNKDYSHNNNMALNSNGVGNGRIYNKSLDLNELEHKNINQFGKRILNSNQNNSEYKKYKSNNLSYKNNNYQQKNKNNKSQFNNNSYKNIIDDEFLHKTTYNKNTIDEIPHYKINEETYNEYYNYSQNIKLENNKNKKLINIKNLKVPLIIKYYMTKEASSNVKETSGKYRNKGNSANNSNYKKRYNIDNLKTNKNNNTEKEFETPESCDKTISKKFFNDITLLMKKLQCNICGLRFDSTDKGKEKMGFHIDEHNRKNRNNENSKTIKKEYFSKIDEFIRRKKIKIDFELLDKFTEKYSNGDSENKNKSSFVCKGDAFCCVCNQKIIKDWSDDMDEWVVADVYKIKENMFCHRKCG